METDQTAPKSQWSSLIWVHIVCIQGYLDHRQMIERRTKVVTGRLRV